MSGGRPAFAGARRQAVPRSTSDWVRPAPDSGRLPLRVQPAAAVDLAGWAAVEAARVDGWLAEHGAVLFRGFGVGLADVAGVAQALAGDALPYLERSTPRTELAPGVYTSTDYPADQPIPLHNENAYQRQFPARLVFCCLTPPGTGGATPLADCRRVLARIPPATTAAFAARAVRYVRNYPRGLGLSWQEVFQTDSRTQVEDYCRANGITATWRADGSLRTEQTRPALAVHPVTGEAVWFNHAAFFHVSRLAPQVRAGLLEQHGEAGLPTNTYYGDGGTIEPAALDGLRAAYAAETVSQPWQRGDVLLVDNLLVAHGREPFTGPRQVVVSMAGALSHDVLPAVGAQP